MFFRKHTFRAILLGFGGQTALNCGLELEAEGVCVSHFALAIEEACADFRRRTAQRTLGADCWTIAAVKAASEARSTTGS